MDCAEPSLHRRGIPEHALVLHSSAVLHRSHSSLRDGLADGDMDCEGEEKHFDIDSVVLNTHRLLVHVPSAHWGVMSQTAHSVRKQVLVGEGSVMGTHLPEWHRLDRQS